MSPIARRKTRVTALVAHAGRMLAVPVALDPNPRPDFSGDFHPANDEIKQERRST
jgi:hypothetical protein